MRPLATALVVAAALPALAGCAGKTSNRGAAPATSATAEPAATTTTAETSSPSPTQTAPASTPSTSANASAAANPSARATSPAQANPAAPASSSAPGTTPASAGQLAGEGTPPAIPRPAIHQWPIPYGAARRHEMAAYSLRHYGEDTAALSNPQVIVEHYTETATAQEAFNTFVPDVPDNEFHELPNTCAHFLVEQSGRIDQLVSLSLRCRHTTGLNWTAIGIENVGSSDREILENRRQLAASLRLTEWLRCSYGIEVKNVIGHNESLSSPFHHDLVATFQHQTHSDWNHADMGRYRALVARHPCPGETA